MVRIRMSRAALAQLSTSWKVGPGRVRLSSMRSVAVASGRLRVRIRERGLCDPAKAILICASSVNACPPGERGGQVHHTRATGPRRPRR